MALFSSRKSDPNATQNQNSARTNSAAVDNGQPARSRSLFGRRNNTSANDQQNVSPNGSRTGSLFNRNKGDSIAQAKASMKEAEAAEKQAQLHLNHAHQTAQAARNHVSQVEHEADAEARAAAAKQKDAKSLRKGAKSLGRI